MTSREKPEHRIAILVSGRGSNMLALARACADGRIPARVGMVLCDVADAPALAAAGSLGLHARFLPPGGSRATLGGDAEAAYLRELHDQGITLVCLAGFMRILKPRFLDAFPGAVLNIHPSLLPAFPGLDAIRRAWQAGVRTTGATVHLVEARVDAGPVILQEAVTVEPGDTLESLTERVHDAEHRIYPGAVALFCEGRLRLEDHHVRILQ